MNVFILCTGRCGSTTFIKACSHISNYSAAHESRTAFLGSERFMYPPWHIEADNRLSWLLGRLGNQFGDRAYYVHLRRDAHETAKSFVKRYDRGIMKSYRDMGVIMGLNEAADPLSVALDYCDTVNSNIDAFLKGRSKVMRIDLERAKEMFPAFCAWIGADIDMEAALAELDVRYNASDSAPQTVEPES